MLTLLTKFRTPVIFLTRLYNHTYVIICVSAIGPNGDLPHAQIVVHGLPHTPKQTQSAIYNSKQLYNINNLPDNDKPPLDLHHTEFTHLSF